MHFHPTRSHIVFAAALLAATGVRAELRFETPTPSYGARARFAGSKGPVGTPALAAPAPGALTPALQASVECFNFDTDSTYNDDNRFIPADAGCAAGPSHVMDIGNCIIEWRPKSFVTNPPQYRASLKDFFSPIPAPSPNPGIGTSLGTYGFNPRVLYDQYAGRFIVVVLELWDTVDGKPSNQSRILLAISKTSDPNDGFWFHSIDSKVNISGADSWADFPGVAVDDKAIYITNNMFTFGVGSYQGVRLWIVRKTAAYAGDDPNIFFIVRNPYATTGAVTTSIPAHMFGTPQTGSGGRPMGTFLLAYSGINDGTDEYLQIVEVTDPLQTVGGPFFTVQQLDVGNIDNPTLPMPDATQKGSAVTIETNDRRMLSAVWRANRLYCAANIRGAAGGPDANQAVARWWRLNTTSTTALTQADAGNVTGEDIAVGTHTYFPAVMVDSDGNMAIGFSASGVNRFPSAYYATRLAGDPPGSTGVPVPLALGVDYYQRYFGGTSNRWGNYSGIALCPAGESDFWVFNQYAGPRGSAQGVEDGRWHTRLGRLRIKIVTAAGNLPSGTRLLQNVPNPFNPSTTIGFTMASRGPVTLTIHDVAGRRVRTLVDGIRDAGSHDAVWDGRDDRGAALASGVYFSRLVAGSHSDSSKMLLVK